MPYLTIYNFAKRILEINPSVRVILFTGHSDDISKEKVEAAGIKALLYKPMGRDQLAESIRKALEK